jgi:hypothetical protein
MFDEELLHNSIRIILGEELSQQMIREAHSYKEPKDARK